MIRRSILCLLALLMLLSFAACGKEQYDLVYAVDQDQLAYCVRGSEKRAKQIVVKMGEEILWSEKVKVDKDVGRQGGTYGFSVLDLNFDGHKDFMIANDVAGDCISYICWLWNTEKNTFEKSEALTGLCNVKTDENLKAVFGFSHRFEREEAYLDVPETTVSTDTATKYIWKDGVLTPEIRVSITHYSETAKYLYSVAYYDENTKKFEDDYSKERWMTAEEYREQDFSFLYYFK